MSVENGKVCCNCRHDIRKWQKEYDREVCRCYCEVDERFMTYTDVMTGWCRHWAKKKRGERMTREEAIEVLAQDLPCEIDEDLSEAMTMAIKALEQQACEDAISRKDMLAIFRQSNSLTQAWDGFEKLPSVTPKEKTGHWEYVQYDGNPNIGNLHCSECDRIAGFEYNFCPNCGARMVSE